MPWERRSARDFLNQPLRLVTFRVHDTSRGPLCLLYVQSFAHPENHGVIRSYGIPPSVLAGLTSERFALSRGARGVLEVYDEWGRKCATGSSEDEPVGDDTTRA
jgi:hypothetical protein